MICIARTFGAPDTVPAGKHDTSASSRSRSSASLPSTIDVRCITWEQRSVHGERIRLYFGLEPLRQHHLIDVARSNALFRCAHLLLEPLARVVRPQVERRLAGGHAVRQVPLELALEKLNLRARELIE